MGLAWLLDGKRIASGGADKTVQLRDAASGRRLAMDKRYSDVVFDVAWLPDGKYLAAACWDGRVSIWQPLV